ncbi:MAG: hypothetical protein PHF39_06030 [Methanoregula sp.]|jgi:hypothetical protein|nr:hypothetical protein [Methanoregula sp.]
MEVHILNILYRDKCFKSNAGYHSEKLKKILRKKYPQDFEEAILHLKNQGIVAAVKKDEPKFYILEKSKTYTVLIKHKYRIAPLGGGRTFHLE